MDNTDNKNNNRICTGDTCDNVGPEGIDISENNQSNEPSNRIETGRNPDGTYQKGFSGNPEGRPKNTLKDYQRQKFQNMTSDEKEEYLKEIDAITKWKMAEGNPHQDNNTELGGEVTLRIAKEVADEYETDTISSDNSEGQK